MKCEEAVQLLQDYWDLPEGDIRKFRVNEHIKKCKSCSEQFYVWKESAELIRSSSFANEPSHESPSISTKVMQQIYEAESWRLPVADRMYSLSVSMRRNLTVVLSICLVLFMFSMVFSVLKGSQSDDPYLAMLSGVQPVGSALGDTRSSSLKHTFHVPVASISEPMMFRMNPVSQNPNYFSVLSLLGLTCALMFMNWFTRTRT
jgi:predicted anti-sigma-YlaC factor YlaD